MYILAGIEMSYYELFLRLLPGCLGALIGVIILIIGIALYSKYKKVREQKPIKATVESCVKGNYVLGADGKVYEIIEDNCLDDCEGTIITDIGNGEFTFVSNFYNGGTCLYECLEDALKPENEN